MRLIDADALCKKLQAELGSPEGHEKLMRINYLITHAPTIEAEPVMRGEWEMAIGYDPKRAFMCDQCHKMAYEPSRYCPHCGARMEMSE